MTTHRAPHKPLLLLSLIDLFAEGSVSSNLIKLNTELMQLFGEYWSLVMPYDTHGSIALPFFHLKSDGFWHLIAQLGKEALLSTARQIRSIHQLNETIVGAQLDEELYTLLCIQEMRDALRTVLIQTYFSAEMHPRLVEQGHINIEGFQYSQKLLEKARTKIVKESSGSFQEISRKVRDQGFRRAVVNAYEHRCAICGIRMLTPDGHTAVDAAHIIPWHISQNDDPRNGMALCRLCHWTFDEGLVTVSSRYLVTVSQLLTANTNVAGHLATTTGRPIIVPVEESLHPDHDALSWHRNKIFRKD
jgi:putative restriction endonuclease